MRETALTRLVVGIVCAGGSSWATEIAVEESQRFPLARGHFHSRSLARHRHISLALAALYLLCVETSNERGERRVGAGRGPSSLRHLVFRSTFC